MTAMWVYIDADGCPVVRQTVRLCRQFGVPCTIVCDTSHEFSFPDVETVVCGKGADSADFALLRRIGPGDLAVTQDYGLAALVLSRGAQAINQDGLCYTQENIDALLTFRAASARIRAGGGRLRGPSRRTPAQDAAFVRQLEQLLRREETTP